MHASNTSHKGTIGVLAVHLAALRKGYIVSTPDEGARYDLVIDRAGKLRRVQIKYITPQNNSIMVKFDATQGTNTQKYDAACIDAIVVYDPESEKIYWLGVECWPKQLTMTLRLEQSKNGQIKNVHLAQDYESW